MLRIRFQEVTLVLLLALVASGTRAASSEERRSLYIKCQLHARSACEPLKRAFFDRHTSVDRVDSAEAAIQVQLRDESTEEGRVVHSTWSTRSAGKLKEFNLPDLVLQEPHNSLAVQKELVSMLSWGLIPQLEVPLDEKKPWKLALMKAPDEELHLVPVRVVFEKKSDDPFDFAIANGVRISTTGVYPFLKKNVTLPKYLQFVKTLSTPDPLDELIYPDKKMEYIAVGISITIGRGGAIFSGKRK